MLTSSIILKFVKRFFIIKKNLFLFLADGANDQFIDLWNEVWNDVIGSMEVALSKYGVSIIIFLRESFNSASWNVKTQVMIF